MKLYPAIDLRGGQAVRLYQGDYDQMTVYNADPVAQAKAFMTAGAKYLHVVDLDGAKDDTTANLQTIAAIATQGGCAGVGVKAIIATDISRDGTMQGTNMDLYRELLTIPGLEITASGGIAALDELAELQKMHCHAAILGKSIYTGAIDLAQAVRLDQD